MASEFPNREAINKRLLRYLSREDDANEAVNPCHWWLPMVAIHHWPEDHWMSLDVIGCWWLALLRKYGQGMSRRSTNTLQIHQPKVLQNQLLLQSHHRVHPWTKKHYPRNQSALVSWQPTSLQPISLWPSYILATLDGAQIVLGCQESKHVHGQTASYFVIQRTWQQPRNTELFNQILMLAWPVMLHLSSVRKVERPNSSLHVNSK